MKNNEFLSSILQVFNIGAGKHLISRIAFLRFHSYNSPGAGFTRIFIHFILFISILI